MFELKCIKRGIWHLHFEEKYDLTMHFLRYEEYYESPEFMKKSVTLVDLMDWYQKNLGHGSFTYPEDWEGFNLPGSQIFELHNKGIEDINRYDRLMLGMAEYIRNKENSDDFYIIGTNSKDPDLASTFNHELCHSLFFVDKIFTEKQTKLVCDLPKKEKGFLFRTLKKLGYHPDVIIDEIQSYMATGLDEDFDKPEIRELQEPFIKTFNKFSKGLRKKAKNA